MPLGYIPTENTPSIPFDIPTGMRPAAYRVDQTAGRTVTVWDYLNNREQVIYADTGIQDITALASNISAGRIEFQHKNGWNTLVLTNLKVTAAGTVSLFPNNNPTMKPWAPGTDGVSGGEANEAIVLGSTGTDYRRAVINYTGGLSIYGATINDVLNGTIVWPMNRSMPTNI